jgi:hypothetical protein
VKEIENIEEKVEIFLSSKKEKYYSEEKVNHNCTDY